MSPKPHPLAALLSQHPEECAAVVAVLCSEGRGEWMRDGIAHHTGVKDIEPILFALGMSGVVTVTVRGCTAPEWRDRYAIARQGAAAWLRGRVGEEPAK